MTAGDTSNMFVTVKGFPNSAIGGVISKLTMDENLYSRLEELRLAALNVEVLAKKLLGFFATTTYKGIIFNVSSNLVIADLSPLAFFGLVEYIKTDGAQAATVRLYERISPLLLCSHRWIEPTIPLDQDGKPIIYGPLPGLGHVLICEFCTAWVIQTPGSNLPTVGRL